MKFKRKIIWYYEDLKENARRLRNNATPAEKELWKHLKGKQMCGYDFHRQKPIYYYIVDFYCSELLLAIELDGTIHKDTKDKDLHRQQAIEDFGVTFLRFSNYDIFNRKDYVLEIIKDCIMKLEAKMRNREDAKQMGI